MTKPLIVTMSSGVRLRLVPLSYQAVAEAQGDARAPEPPVRMVHVFGDAEGEASEPMPMRVLDDIEGLEDDPQYETWKGQIEQFQDVQQTFVTEQLQAGYDLMYVQSLWPVNGDGSDLSAKQMGAPLKAMGFEVPTDSFALRVQFLRQWAVRTNLEELDLFGMVGELNIPTEEGAKAAFARFRLDLPGDAAGAGGPTGEAESGGEPGVPTTGSRRKRRRPKRVPAGRTDEVPAGDALSVE